MGMKRQKQTGNKKRVYLYLEEYQIEELRRAAEANEKSLSKWIQDEIKDKLAKQLNLDLKSESDMDV